MRESADALARLVTARSQELSEHGREVAELAEAAARRLGLSDREIERVRVAGELHDVGKLAVPRSILNKPTKLDDREWELMRTHTLVGERILRATPALAGVAKLVRSSHERVDGTGYPDRLVGGEIPLGARIVAACDAFTAMTSDRPYALARAVDEAVHELRRGCGTQFDPMVVDVVCAVIDERRNARRQSVVLA